METKLAGSLLFTGSLLVLITITLEFNIGWLNVDLSTEEGRFFIQENWEGMNKIWSAQFIGFILWSVAFLILLKAENDVRALLWSALLVCMVMVVVGYSLTLGAYPPALEVLKDSPEIFKTVRGAVSVLYGKGIMACLLLLLVNFLVETFRKSGRVTIKLGSITLLTFIIGLVVGEITTLPMKLTSATIFFIPLATGLSLMVAKKNDKPSS